MGYRLKFGSSDSQIVAALRRHFGAGLTMTYEQIIEAIGWAYIPASAIREIGPLFKGRRVLRRQSSSPARPWRNAT